MSKPLKAAYRAMQMLVLLGMAVLTLAVFSPQSLPAEEGCSDQACTDKFGECKEGNAGGPWEGTHCHYSHCSGNGCYYVCGGEGTCGEAHPQQPT
mgnify:CR=1 FL=1